MFAYGSLMDPASLTRNLPGAALGACVPATCHGLVRSFGVAFPNAGSEADKAYFDVAGMRPDVVLFCDLSRAERRLEDRFHGRDGRFHWRDGRAEGRDGGWVNGVCVPVDQSALDALTRRERRYRLVDVTDRVAPYAASGAAVAGSVFAFVGRRRFTRPEDVARGVVPAEYVATVARGARHWDRRCPGFAEDFRRTTERPAARVVPLRRVDWPERQ